MRCAGESSEAQKANIATQCDFDSHEDYNLASSQMALLNGLVGKKQLNGKLSCLERPVNNNRQRWCAHRRQKKKQWHQEPHKTWSEYYRASLETPSQTSWRRWTMELCSGSSHSWTPRAS